MDCLPSFSIIYAENTPQTTGSTASQGLDRSISLIAVTVSGIVYILSLAIFCVCGFLCGHYTRKPKQSQNFATSHNANKQVHPPPTHPAPVYEDVRPSKAKMDNKSERNINLDSTTSRKAEQPAHPPSVGHPAPVYEDLDVLPVRRKTNKNVIGKQLQDLETKENVAYCPISC